MSGGGLPRLCGFFAIEEEVSQPGPGPSFSAEHVPASHGEPVVVTDPKLATREQELHQEVQKAHPEAHTQSRRDTLTINTACIHEFRASVQANNATRSGFAAAARLEPAFSMPHNRGFGGARSSMGFQRMTSESMQQGERAPCTCMHARTKPPLGAKARHLRHGQLPSPLPIARLRPQQPASAQEAAGPPTSHGPAAGRSLKTSSMPSSQPRGRAWTTGRSA